MNHLYIFKVFYNYKKYLQKIFPFCLGYLINKELVLIVPKSKSKNVILFLKKHTHSLYHTLSDISGVDYPYKKNRFEIAYNLLSITYNARINIITFIDELTTADSISKIHKCSIWFEREVWDMFGIYFYKNNDLRRILTDYGFKGHPLRKDFPLTGYTEVRFDELTKRVITEKVSLAQDYRDFNFNSNWASFKTKIE